MAWKAFFAWQWKKNFYFDKLVSREYIPEGSQGDELDFHPTEFKD